MQELIGKCKKCLGCNRLENLEFAGVYRCEYAIEGEKNERKPGNS